MPISKNCVSRTIYVGKVGSEDRLVFDLFEDNCLKRGLKVGPRVLGLMKSENERLALLTGMEVPKPKLDFEGLKEKRMSLKKAEYQLRKLLDSVYSSLCDFFELDGKHPEGALERALNFDGDKCGHGFARFSKSDLESFIEYIETVMERRKVEEQIKDYRLKKSNSA